MKVAILGHGSVGSALGERLAETGHHVVFGVRPGRDLAEILERCRNAAAASGADELGSAEAASPAEAVRRGEIVFLAVPAEAAVEALADTEIDGKVVVDCTNPLTWDDGPVWAPPTEGSVTARLAAAYPRARPVKGFSTFGLAFHRDPTLAGPPAELSR